MKNFIFLMLVFCISNYNYHSIAQIEHSYSAAEILDRAVQFHNPQGNWHNYAGVVKLNTSFSYEHTYGTEIIEIDVSENFYKCIRLAGETRIEKGVKDNQSFRSINGNSNLTEEELIQFGLTDQGIMNIKEWHYFHFGKLPFFITIGSELQNQVTRNNFRGKDCYVLTFIGDSSKVTNPRWAGEVIFYIDVNTFATNGIRWSERGVYDCLEGFMNINGVKLPRVRASYTIGDNQIQFVDFFTRADDNFSLPKGYHTVSKVTGSNISIVSTHLLKLDNEAPLKRLRKPLAELNALIAEIGYPECGYVIYKVNSDFDTDYTHILEGRWMSENVYNYIHNHPKYIELFEKHIELFENVLRGQTYFRMQKKMPNP